LQDIIKHSPEFKDLSINRKNIFKYLGYPDGLAPEPYTKMLEDMLNIAENVSLIKATLVLFDKINISTRSNSLNINHVEFETGKIIAEAVQNAETIALFVCTVGPGIENKSKELFKENNMVEGYMLDVIGSEVVESAIDLCQDILQVEMKRKELSLSNRYSPGYCGWNVSEQHKLFSLLPRDFCDIRLKESALMVPIKSVSGIIGIGKDIVRRGYACDFCEQENCVYRKGSF